MQDSDGGTEFFRHVCTCLYLFVPVCTCLYLFVPVYQTTWHNYCKSVIFINARTCVPKKQV